MKKTTLLLLLLLFSVLSFQCKKENAGKSSARIEEIIDKSSRSELQKLGMDIFNGNKPPNVEGVISMVPNLLLKSNIPNDAPANQRFVDYLIKIYNQKSDNSISVRATGTGGSSPEVEESLDAAISGSGNNFTIYGSYKITVGANSLILANVYSGTLEGEKVKNFKRAFIVVDDTRGSANLLKKGQARVFFDGDKSSSFSK